MNPIVLVWERGVIHIPHNIRTTGTPCITNLIDGAGGMIRKTDSANLCAELPHTAPHGAICLWKPMARIAFKKNPSLQRTPTYRQVFPDARTAGVMLWGIQPCGCSTGSVNIPPLSYAPRGLPNMAGNLMVRIAKPKGQSSEENRRWMLLAANEIAASLLLGIVV